MNKAKLLPTTPTTCNPIHFIYVTKSAANWRSAAFNAVDK